jgi:hypothetical protein
MNTQSIDIGCFIKERFHFSLWGKLEKFVESLDYVDQSLLYEDFEKIEDSLLNSYDEGYKDGYEQGSINGE